MTEQKADNYEPYPEAVGCGTAALRIFYSSINITLSVISGRYLPKEEEYKLYSQNPAKFFWENLRQTKRKVSGIRT